MKGWGMKGHIMTVAAILVMMTILAGCVGTQTIVVQFEDLRNDLFAMELALQNGEWAHFDWDNMTITISRLENAMILGAFEVTPSPVPNSTAPALASRPVPVSSDDGPDLDLRSVELTPRIREIMGRRQARLGALNEMKDAERIGENNHGYLSFRAPRDSFSEDEARIVNRENEDRSALLDEIMRQQEIPPENREDVERQFANVQRRLARPGHWIQNDDGDWLRIPPPSE